jgi:hypothetical protein
LEATDRVFLAMRLASSMFDGWSFQLPTTSVWFDMGTFYHNARRG